MNWAGISFVCFCFLYAFACAVYEFTDQLRHESRSLKGGAR